MTAETLVRQRAYRTELDPNAVQRQRCLQHAGAVRFLYNLALERCTTQYALATASGRSQQRPSAMSLNRELTVLKQTECPWLYEVNNSALQNALRQLDAAYTNFFRRLRAGIHGRKAGFPRPKSRKRGVGSFKLNGAIHVDERHVTLPGLGRIKLKEAGYLPTAGVRITSATVSERAGRWFVALQVEEPVATPDPPTGRAAVHLGVRRLASITEDGQTVRVVENPRHLGRRLRSLKRQQRALSRCQTGSNNREKQRRRVARLHLRIADSRKTALHQLTTAITKGYGELVIDHFDVATMLEERRVSRQLADASLGEIRRQLCYKADWRGVLVTESPVAYPVTRRCSHCGFLNEEVKSTVFRCASCGHTEDRDDNSCRNLWQLFPAGP